MRRLRQLEGAVGIEMYPVASSTGQEETAFIVDGCEGEGKCIG